MVTIPNFKLRASGTHTYRRMKDKEAGKCIYCEDYSKKIGCKHVYCPYILERAEMGSIDYAGVLNETFRKKKKIPNMQNRLDKLAESYDGNMFLSAEHGYRFYIALRKIRMVCSRPTNRYISAIYLLTTTSRLDCKVQSQPMFTNV